MQAATWDHLHTAGLDVLVHVTNAEWGWDASFEAQENEERNILRIDRISMHVHLESTYGYDPHGQ